MRHSHRVIAYIDLAALQHNILCIKRHAPQTSLLAMVKSNAYGHGSVEIAKFLQFEVDAFGVACLDEAIRLFNAEVKKPIVIMMGFLDMDELRLVERYGFEPVIHNHLQLALLEKAKLKRKLNIWLKIDTGMHRLGFQPNEIHDVYQRLIQTCKVRVPPRLMTHFSDSDDLRKAKTLEQCRLFSEITTNLPGEKSLANSAAILKYADATYGWIRPGGIMYGISLIPNKTASQLGFKPVMKLTSRLLAIHDLKKGDAVGYGSTWICPEPMRVGIISIGYGDGYARSAKFGTPVLIKGIESPLIGRVAMDMIAVDLRKNPQVQNADEVILWGKELPLEIVASHADTIPYELICRLTSRVHYRYVP